MSLVAETEGLLLHQVLSTPCLVVPAASADRPSFKAGSEKVLVTHDINGLQAFSLELMLLLTTRRFGMQAPWPTCVHAQQAPRDVAPRSGMRPQDSSVGTGEHMQTSVQVCHRSRDGAGPAPGQVSP